MNTSTAFEETTQNEGVTQTSNTSTIDESTFPKGTLHPNEDTYFELATD